MCPSCHRGSIGKTLFGTVFLYEACGRHARLVAPRRSIEDQRGDDPATWRVLPHATIVYRLFPNAVLVSQGRMSSSCASSPTRRGPTPRSAASASPRPPAIARTATGRR